MRSRSSQPRGPRGADCARWGGTRGDRHHRERDLSDAARARASADRRRSARAHRAPTCRSRTEATGRSSATRSTRCFAAARLLAPTRFRSSNGQRAGCWVCTRPGAVDRPHTRTARCSVGSSRSTVVASAPISSGTRSACASTSSPSSSTWSRSGVAAMSNASWLPRPAPLRWDPVRPLTGPGDWLARIRWVDGAPHRDLRRWLRSGNGNGWIVVVPGAPPQRLAPSVSREGVHDWFVPSTASIGERPVEG